MGCGVSWYESEPVSTEYELLARMNLQARGRCASFDLEGSAEYLNQRLDEGVL